MECHWRAERKWKRSCRFRRGGRRPSRGRWRKRRRRRIWVKKGWCRNLPLLPDGEAYSVQSEAKLPLLTFRSSKELVAVLPEGSVTLALKLCVPLDRAVVFTVRVQLVVPEAFA